MYLLSNGPLSLDRGPSKWSKQGRVSERASWCCREDCRLWCLLRLFLNCSVLFAMPWTNFSKTSMFRKVTPSFFLSLYGVQLVFPFYYLHKGRRPRLLLPLSIPTPSKTSAMSFFCKLTCQTVQRDYSDLGM